LKAEVAKLFRNLISSGKNKENRKAVDLKRISLHQIAWLLFLVCGIIYLAASVRDGDILMAAGSVCFIVAVILFLLPENNPDETKGDLHDRKKRSRT
jgi:hypothetical protein